MYAPVFGRVFTRLLFDDRLCLMLNETRRSYYRSVYCLTPFRQYRLGIACVYTGTHDPERMFAPLIKPEECLVKASFRPNVAGEYRSITRDGFDTSNQ